MPKPRLHVSARQCAVVVAGEDEPRILRVKRRPRRFIAYNRLPIRPNADLTPAESAARHLHRLGILLAAIEMVWKQIVGAHSVELRRRLILNFRPAPPAGEADFGATVVRVDHVLWIGRIDPQRMSVAVARFHFDEGFAAVLAF